MKFIFSPAKYPKFRARTKQNSCSCSRIHVAKGLCSAVTAQRKNYKWRNGTLTAGSPPSRRCSAYAMGMYETDEGHSFAYLEEYKILSVNHKWSILTTATDEQAARRAGFLQQTPLCNRSWSQKRRLCRCTRGNHRV